MSDVLSKEQQARIALTNARLQVNDFHACSTADELDRWRAAQSRLIEAAGAVERLEVEALRAEIASVWWVLGRSYQDQYGTLADAMKDVGKRLQAAENPPDWSAGFVAGKETNDFLVKAANMRAEALRAEVASLRGQTCATCKHKDGEPIIDDACKCLLLQGTAPALVLAVRPSFGCNQWAARDTARAEGEA